MWALVVGHLIFASASATTLTFLGGEACEDFGSHAYVLDLRSAERMDSGLYRVAVVETLKGSPRAHWDLHVAGLMHWIRRSSTSEEKFLERVGRAYVIILEDSSVLNVPGCRPALEDRRQDEGAFEQVLLSAKTYMRLRENPELKDVLSALRSPRERDGAFKMLYYVDAKSVPGVAWDAIGMAVVEELRRRPPDEMSLYHYAVLSSAARGARKWHESERLPPPSWFRSAGDVVFKRLETGGHAVGHMGTFCALFRALLDEKSCSLARDLLSREVRMRIKEKVERLPAPRED